MSGNPNMQKIGKRKVAPGRQQPDWLFPAAEKSQNEGKPSKAQDKKPASDLPKPQAIAEPAMSAHTSQLVGLVGAFLAENNFTSASRSLAADKKNGGNNAADLKGVPSLSTIYNEWLQLKGTKAPSKGNTIKLKTTLKAKPKDTSGSSSGDSSDSSSDEDEDSDVEMADAAPAKRTAAKKSASSSSASSSSASSSSDSDADDENEVPVVKAASPKVKVNALKRKDHPATDSSSSDSDSSSDSSSEEEAPKPKKLKTTASDALPKSSEKKIHLILKPQAPPKAASASSSSSDSDSGSDSDSSSDAEATKAVAASSSSGSDSSSDSESDSDSDSSTNSIAQKVPLPDSGSESSSDSDSDASAEKAVIKSQGSDTSATISDGHKGAASSSSDSSESSSSDSEAAPKETAKVEKAPARKLSPPLPPTPVAKLPRKTNERFSRIPKDIKVDERLASNAYVPYDYAENAHRDLIVTKGKGFTKEKNKKKRGSFKGGYIDVEGKKGIKFED